MQVITGAKPVWMVYNALMDLRNRVRRAWAEVDVQLKRRHRLHGCQVCLDHIPSSGWFVEIEGPQRQIIDIARRLGLTASDREHRSYRKLIKAAAAPMLV